ncbi:MAG: sigma 54-interacting transcriptional regulator [Terracidiphilus sp.]
MGSPVIQSERFEDRFPLNVFVVSPNAHLRQALQDKLSTERWNVVQTGSGAGALEILRKFESEEGVLLLDPMLPDLEPNGFRAIVQNRFPLTQVLMLNSQTGQLLVGSASPTPVSARLVDEINNGGAAGHTTYQSAYQPSAAAQDSLRVVPDRNHIKLRGMIGNCDSMQRTWAVARMVAARNTTVLITGESGTGKDLLAQEIHLISPRRNQPFVVVNCSAIPESLLEAELFGYTKGSFTGAVQSRIGRIHSAHGGTLFLDEIGDMPVSLQSKLLRFLEQGEVQRLGGNDNLKVDVRVVAATNADLKKMVANQQFREDLYYRLAVFPIHLPPLRQRMEDMDELAVSFAARFLPGSTLSAGALQVLSQHAWPGNIRELRNAVERATILVGSGHEIKAEHILL